MRDLARGQSMLRHEVAIICDATTGGEAARSALAAAEAYCSLGVHRIAIGRLPGIGDIAASRAVADICRRLAPDVLHGHGAKGGVYARLAGRRLGVPSFYTPHGGSLHYEWTHAPGLAFLAAERFLVRYGSGMVFVCAFEQQAFERKIGLGGLPSCVVHNGLWPEEFSPALPHDDASDILFIGEMRELKGVSELLTAIGILSRERQVSATIAGDGPQRQEFEAQAGGLGITRHVNFAGAMPAAKAFALGRVFVMPSRAESFPYVVLEAAAAELPVVATAVGGIPEIMPASDLVPPRDPRALADAIGERLRDPATAKAKAQDLARSLRMRFSAQRMSAEITAFYEAVRNGAKG